MTIPKPALVLLVGPSGAGKSTFAAAHFKATEIVSSDALRAMVSDDEGDQDASREAFRLLALIVNGRLSRRLTTVVDAINLRAVDRRRYQQQAARFGMPTIAIAFDLSTTTYHARNEARPGRVVGAHVVDDQAARMADVLADLKSEKYTAVYVIGDDGDGGQLWQRD